MVKRNFTISILSFGVLALVGGLYVGIPEITATKYESKSEVVKDDVSVKSVKKDKKEEVAHIVTPEQVKAIYMTQCVVGTPNFRDDLVEIADTTEINSIIIDIKDFSGFIAFPAKNPIFAGAVMKKCGAHDMKKFIQTLHDKGIYVIGRITVFQDPYRTSTRPDLAVKKASDGSVWKDYKGLSFIDAGAEDHWEYIVELAKESYNIGFDEINFDYIRFPSDGNMKDIAYTFAKGRTKPEVVRDFFKYVHDNLKDTGLKTSADLFGMTTTNTDDLNIGQVLENAFPYFDYIAPMVYPSHYPKGFNGWSNPNEHVYDLIHFVIKSAVHRAIVFDNPPPIPPSGTTTPTSTPQVLPKTSPTVGKIRPWVQDFDYGGTYDIPEVKAQIQAMYDVGVNSWMIWAPSNRYTIGALKKE